MVRAMNLSGSAQTFKPSPPSGHPAGSSRAVSAPPFPFEYVEVFHPAIGPSLDGLTILHLTDLHVRQGHPTTPFRTALAQNLSQLPVDLAVFTGDAMNYPGDEDAAMEAMSAVVGACRASRGMVGVFGNHDSPSFRDRAAEIPGIRWLRDEVLDLPDIPLTLVGPEDPEDLLGTLVAAPAIAPGRFPIALVHYPTEIYPAAELGIPLVLAGHTHGGQLRLSPNFAPHTSTDLPGSLACGITRLRETLCCVPRGLGQAVVELRFNCPPQAPIYILRRGPLPFGACKTLTRLTAW